MNKGNGDSIHPVSWSFQGEMAAALWANWRLWSLQMLHEFNRACLTFAAGSCSGGMKATRFYWESMSKGISAQQIKG